MLFKHSMPFLTLGRSYTVFKLILSQLLLPKNTKIGFGLAFNMLVSNTYEPSFLLMLIGKLYIKGHNPDSSQANAKRALNIATSIIQYPLCQQVQ